MSYRFARGQVSEDVQGTIDEHMGALAAIGGRLADFGDRGSPFPGYTHPSWSDHPYKIRWPNGRTVWVVEPYEQSGHIADMAEWLQQHPQWVITRHPEMTLWNPPATVAYWIERVEW